MDEKIITRKFLKPLKGTGELRKLDQHVADVRYFLQAWQDFPINTTPEERKAEPHISGMGGEITFSQEDRKKVRVEEVLKQEFILHTEKHADYEIQVYKVKDNNPGKGRYSVTCKLPEELTK